MQLAGFVPPIDDELSDEAGVGCQQGRVNKKKRKERSRTAVEQALSVPVLTSHKIFTKFAEILLPLPSLSRHPLQRFRGS